MTEANRIRANEIVASVKALQEFKDEIDGGTPFKGIKFYGGDTSATANNESATLEDANVPNDTDAQSILTVIEDCRANMSNAIQTLITDLNAEKTAL